MQIIGSHSRLISCESLRVGFGNLFLPWHQVILHRLGTRDYWLVYQPRHCHSRKEKHKIKGLLKVGSC